MPELPEAEANRRRVEEGALNRTIEGFEEHNTRHLDLPSDAERERLVGRQFTETRRHGKLIFAGSRQGPWIAVHLGMTGSLRCFDEEPDLGNRARIVIRFEGGRRLAFVCPRKLGWLRVIDDPDAFLEAEGWGPDALALDRAGFAERVGATRGAVKSALMQQKKLAGIGNLWSDEALYHAGIAPDARADRLRDDRIGGLHDAVRAVLRRVLDCEEDYGSLPADWLIHRREAGAECPRCGGTIARKTVGGRTSFHCPDHQTGPA